MDRVGRPQTLVPGEASGVDRDRAIQLDNRQIHPSAVDLGDRCRQLVTREPLVAGATGKRRMALHVGDTRAGPDGEPAQQVDDEVTPRLLQKRLDEGARIQVQDQSRSSAM